MNPANEVFPFATPPQTVEFAKIVPPNSMAEALTQAGEIGFQIHTAIAMGL